jgi:glutamine synthetase
VTADLAKIAKERKIKYFLISYTDLFGVLRAKLAPAAAIGDMQRDGAGFAGFATWLDMTPAHPDLFAKPDPDSLIQLPWKPEVGWLASDLWMDGKEVADSPRAQLKKMVARAARNGHRMKSGVECEYFLITPDGKSHVHNLEPDDLVALTVEAAAMEGVPLAGTSWIPGKNGM